MKRQVLVTIRTTVEWFDGELEGEGNQVALPDCHLGSGGGDYGHLYGRVVLFEPAMSVPPERRRVIAGVEARDLVRELAPFLNALPEAIASTVAKAACS